MYRCAVPKNVHHFASLGWQKSLPSLSSPFRLSCKALNTLCYVATGKARGPWCKKVLPKLGAPMPGVYMQGLLLYNADGTIMHEESLSEDLVRETITLAKELGMWPVQRALCHSLGTGAQHLMPFTFVHLAEARQKRYISSILKSAAACCMTLHT